MDAYLLYNLNYILDKDSRNRDWNPKYDFTYT